MKGKTTVRFLVLYKKPENPDVFDQHDRDLRIPRTKKLPGLHYTISRNVTGVRGERYYLIAALEVAIPIHCGAVSDPEHYREVLDAGATFIAEARKRSVRLHRLAPGEWLEMDALVETRL
jgi:hypothetical protein